MIDCPQGIKDCKTCRDNKFYVDSQRFLKSNKESLKDFIRWKELGWLLGTLVIGFLLFKGWGIILALILDRLNHMEGGPAIYKAPEIEIKTIKKTFYCKLCEEEHLVYLEDKNGK